MGTIAKGNFLAPHAFEIEVMNGESKPSPSRASHESLLSTY